MPLLRKNVALMGKFSTVEAFVEISEPEIPFKNSELRLIAGANPINFPSNI